MAKYYYLLASLPLLRLGEKPLIDKKEFLRLCSEHCSKSDYKAVLSASLNGKEESNLSFMKAFCKFRRMLNSELSFLRSQALKKNEELYKNNDEKEERISQQLRKAVYSSDPLEGERIILSLYDGFLQDYSAFHYFDLDALLVYSLRLDILSRESLFSVDEGNAEFSRLFDNLKQDIFLN